MNNLFSDAAINAVGSLSAPVFLAGFDSPAKLTLHVSRTDRSGQLAREAREALRNAGIEAKCVVREFDQRHFDKARSLQELLPYFAHEGIVFDPTGTVIRANALVRLADRLRAALGKTVGEILLEAEGRALDLICRKDEVAREGRESVQAKCAAVAEAWRREDAGSFPLEIRLRLEAPELPMVPVDRASVPASLRSPWARLQTGVLVSGFTALLGAVSPRPAAASGPAVSQPNAKVSLDGGVINGTISGTGEASATIPVGHSFGAQVDATGGVSDERSLWGVAGQGFWRDPEVGLLGAFASHAARTSAELNQKINVNRYGGEGAYYYGRLTGSLAAGDIRGQAPHGAFVDVGITWYPQDNLALSAGADIKPGPSLALLGVEYQLAASGLPGLSVFADAGVSDKNGKDSGQPDGYTLAGFRYYFGPTKPLIRRHREDDPPSGAAFGGGVTAGGGVAGGTSTSQHGY